MNLSLPKMHARCLALLVCLAAAFTWRAQAAEDKMQPLSDATRIEAVTVFLDRAQVQRTLTREIAQGRYILSIPNLPVSLQDDSLRVAGKGSAAVRILDIKVREEKAAETVDPRLKELEAKKEEIADKIKALDDRREALKARVAFLERVGEYKASSPQLDSALSRRSLDEWAKIADFIDSGLTRVQEESRRIGQQRQRLLDQQAALDHELAQQKSVRRKERKTVEVQFAVQEAGSMKLTLSYIVAGATWMPTYDLRLAGGSREAGLIGHAMVQQETGEEWPDVMLTLSTARAMLLKSPPELVPLYVDQEPALYSGGMSMGQSAVHGLVTDNEGSPLPGVTVVLTSTGVLRQQAISDENGRYAFNFIPAGDYELKSDLEGFSSTRRRIWVPSGKQLDVPLSMRIGAIEEAVTVRASAPVIDMKSTAKEMTFGREFMAGTSRVPGSSTPQKVRVPDRAFQQETALALAVERSLNVTYTLKQRETIPSTGEPQKVTVAMLTLPCEKEYKAVPRLAEPTYLKVKVTNGADLPLLPGKASIFYDDNFVSASEIPAVSANEEFSIFVGEESGIRVKREVKSKKESGGLFSRKAKKIYDVCIRMENFHDVEELVRIQDLIPQSESKKIDIELLGMSVETVAGEEAQKERKEKGILTWELKLKGREKREIHFSYRITHPEDATFFDPEK